jgi:hypothetical protein
MYKQSALTIALTLATTAGPALAGITTTDPGLYNNTSTLVQARIRLDQGGSQTWKAAFWQNTTMLSNSGVQGPNPPVWTNAVAYDWTITYNAGTGAGSMQVLANQTVVTTANFGLSAGQSLAGFYFFTNSTYAGGTDPAGPHSKTEVYDIAASANGGPATTLASITSDFLQNFVQGPNFYFDAPTTTLQLTGKIRFTWNTGANISADRNKLTLILLQGTPIPTPGTTALLALGLFVGTRRKR